MWRNNWNYDDLIWLVFTEWTLYIIRRYRGAWLLFNTIRKKSSCFITTIRMFPIYIYYLFLNKIQWRIFVFTSVPTIISQSTLLLLNHRFCKSTKLYFTFRRTKLYCVKQNGNYVKIRIYDAILCKTCLLFYLQIARNEFIVFFF